MDLNYLESADSIHVDYEKLQLGDRAASVESRFKELQLFLEMVSVLAMGRTVMVPQPFAFDSYVFLKTATRIWTAFDEGGKVGLPPIQLHLYGDGIDSFEKAIQSMLRRSLSQDGNFHFSSYPELNKREWNVDPADGSGGVLRSLADGDPRKGPLGEAVARFQHTGSNRYARPAPEMKLGEVLVRVISSETLLDEPDLRGALRGAADTLELASCKLNERSYLRSPAPWPRDGKRSARELVADDAVFEPLIEIMDTLYNRVVAHTSGAKYQSYTTHLGTDGDLLHSLGLVQDAAVRAFGSPQADTGRALDVHIQSTTPLPPETLEAFLAEALRKPALVSGLADLLRARGDQHSDFSKSLRELAAAKKPTEHARHMERHLDMVAHILGHGYLIRPSDLLWSGVGVGLTIGGVAADNVVNLPDNVLGAAITGAIVIGGAAAALVPQLLRQGENRRAERTCRRALGSVLREV